MTPLYEIAKRNIGNDADARNRLDSEFLREQLSNLEMSPVTKARLLMAQLNHSHDERLAEYLVDAILCTATPESLCKELIQYCPPTERTMRALAQAAVKLMPDNPLSALLDAMDALKVVTVFDSLKTDRGVSFYPPAAILGACFSQAFGLLLDDPLNGFSRVVSSVWNGGQLHVTFEQPTFGHAESAFIIRPFIFGAQYLGHS